MKTCFLSTVKHGCCVAWQTTPIPIEHIMTCSISYWYCYFSQLFQHNTCGSSNTCRSSFDGLFSLDHAVYISTRSHRVPTVSKNHHSQSETSDHYLCHLRHFFLGGTTICIFRNVFVGRNHHTCWIYNPVISYFHHKSTAESNIPRIHSTEMMKYLHLDEEN